MESTKSVSVEVTVENSPKDEQSADDLVMAWAVDATTGQPRYILELERERSGGRCNCKCPSCDLMLTAVNAGKLVWKKRPHFRHPPGAAREKCMIVAARKAVEAMFVRQQQIVLPRRRRSRDVEGLSGTYFNAWVERPAERVGIRDCAFVDEARAILSLEDGRRLVVQLVGRGEAPKDDGVDDRLTAKIEIRVDDPAVADMQPEDILSRLELSWAQGCWIRHWADDAMDVDAEAEARDHAVAALDWLDDGELTDGLTPAERRETLLHREVKAILDRERRIRVPELHVSVERKCANGTVAKRSWSQPSVELVLASVELEVHLGRSVPDVIATWIDEDGLSQSMMIEVTVTNPIGEERVSRLATYGWPALEIDIGRMGGVVTKHEFTRLVVEEVAGKTWIYHPFMEEERERLDSVLQSEEARAIDAEQRRRAVKATPAAEWANRYLDAVRRRWLEQKPFENRLADTDEWKQAQADIKLAIHALLEHGYPATLLDEYPLRRIVARILSFQDGVGIEYRQDVWGIINAIFCDGVEARKWHTLYLIALKAYPPALSKAHFERLSNWRRDVVTSIRSESETYVRETTYDRLIGLLFPEMREALREPFGTPLYIPERELEYDPDRELTVAAFRAKQTGERPDEFAKRYAALNVGQSSDEILDRLIRLRNARTSATWDD